ncbi:hypothetical protein BS50DRAFT_571717, partial [Corynespora cassiicola Philippines]
MLFGIRRVLPLAICLLLLAVFWYARDKQHQPPPLVLDPAQRFDGLAAPAAKPERLPFYPGVAKPPGANYSRTLVVAKLKKEHVAWIRDELPEIEAAIYEVDGDDPSAKFRVPKNKGHEAMVYLSHIIDHYDDLADTTIFIHAHQSTWHNNVLLNLDMPTTIRRLRDDRVARQGYMNLRCHLDPGCPNWIHLDRAEVDFDLVVKPEEKHFSFGLFESLFPGHRPPPVLSQPCCAQFAVSRERIWDNPKSTYQHLRNWLLETSLQDKDSGRIFEYMWQYLFTRNAEHCPSMNACYCDGYGICFGNQFKLDEWLAKLRKREMAEEDFMNAQREKKDKAALDEISNRIRKYNLELLKEKNEAYKRGDEEMNRAKERER